MPLTKVPLVNNGDALFATTINRLQNNLEPKTLLNAWNSPQVAVGGTTSTSYVEMDATNLKNDFTTNGGDILVMISGSFFTLTNFVGGDIAIYVDGVSVATSRIHDAITTYRGNGVLWTLLSGDDYPAGTYTIAARYKTTSSTFDADLVTLTILEL